MTYKLDQRPVAGESYIRCPQVVIDNRLGHAPTATFHRERIIGLADGAIVTQPMSPREVAFDPLTTVPVLDPETGESTGRTVAQAELYQMIYSAFIAAENEEPST